MGRAYIDNLVKFGKVEQLKANFLCESRNAAS